MSEYIISLKDLAILMAKCHGTKLVEEDGTPVCDPSEIAEGIDKPLRMEEVVRCRDCKHGHEVTWPVQLEIPSDYLDCAGYLVELWDYWTDDFKDNPVPPDGFCAWAKRREP